jgi:hypothetical protein
MDERPCQKVLMALSSYPNGEAAAHILTHPTEQYARDLIRFGID